MPRKDPTTSLDVSGKLNIIPGINYATFYASKENNKFFMKEPVSLDDDYETAYLSARYEHARISKLLVEMRKQRKLQKVLNIQRKVRILKDLIKLRSRLVATNMVIREFREKRKREEKNIRNEIAIEKKLCEAIEEKSMQVSVLKTFRKELLATANDYEVYETVLQSAADKLHCPSIEVLIDKCNAILLAGEEIEQSNTVKMVEIMQMRNAIVELLKHAEIIAKGLKTELNELSRSYHKAINDCLRWERNLKNTHEELLLQEREDRIAKMGIHEMYRLLCKKRDIKETLRREQIQKMLDFIKDEVETLQEVLHEYYSRSK